MLKFEEVTKTFRLGEAAWTFGPASFYIEQGEGVAVLGKSGAGKSTLLHLLGGLQSPESGRILFQDKDIGKMWEKKRNEFRNRKIGFVFQDFFLFDEFPLLENVAMPLLVRGVKHASALASAREMLKKVGLAEKEQNRPAELSGGQRQRAAIARAVIGEPALILADEPTGNLDTATGREILVLLKELLTRTGATLVIVTHDAEVADAMERRIELQDGKIIHDSSL